mmetsp:Transcript_8367/g.18745  ORF Transcript_8367/g.18745 Transcript_8367/m.18745 type:complete len:309 (+) Transcript_8367:2976-3902(+)
MRSQTPHLIQKPAITVRLVISRDLAIPQDLGCTDAAVISEVGTLIIHQDHVLQSEVAQLGSQLRVTTELRQPAQRLDSHMRQKIRFVLLDFVARASKQAPSAIFKKCAIAVTLWSRHAPYGTEMLQQIGQAQQIQHGHYTTLVLSQDGQGFVLSDLFKKRAKFLHSASINPRTLEVVLHKVLLTPVLELCFRWIPANLGGDGLATRHEGGHGERLVKIKDHQLHRWMFLKVVEVTFLTSHVHRFLAHPWVFNETLQGVVISVMVRTNAPHVLHHSHVIVQVGIISSNFAISQHTGSELALKVGTLIIN